MEKEVVEFVCMFPTNPIASCEGAQILHKGLQSSMFNGPECVSEAYVGQVYIFVCEVCIFKSCYDQLDVFCHVLCYDMNNYWLKVHKSILFFVACEKGHWGIGVEFIYYVGWRYGFIICKQQGVVCFCIRRWFCCVSNGLDFLFVCTTIRSIGKNTCIDKMLVVI